MSLRVVSNDETPTELLPKMNGATDDEHPAGYWRVLFADLGPIGWGILITAVSVMALICEGIINALPGGAHVSNIWLDITASGIVLSVQVTLILALKQSTDRRSALSDERTRRWIEHETYLLSAGQQSVIAQVNKTLTDAEKRNAEKIAVMHRQVVDWIQELIKTLDGYGDGRYADGKADAAIAAYAERNDMTGTDGRGFPVVGVASVTPILRSVDRN